MCVGGMHLHLLAQFPLHRRKPMLDERGSRNSAVNDPVRHILGLAKQWSSKTLIREGHVSSGVWGKKGKIVVARDRSHYQNVVRYILRHENAGAVVWSAG